MNSNDWFSRIDCLNFSNKTILIIGGGYMAIEYLKASKKLNIKNIIIIANEGRQIQEYCEDDKIKLLKGGFMKCLKEIPKSDLAIIACPQLLTIDALNEVLKYEHQNILVEKPGSLHHTELSSIGKKYQKRKIKVAYNRSAYPSLHKLKMLVKKEGGITSCKFTFTEWLDRIDFKKDPKEVYDYWGISNSLHVISMAFDIIGMPKKMNVMQSGKLKWHKAGKIFVGSGISEQNIPFSYHADWGSGGRWGIEIMTKNNSYRLMPLEELEVCATGKTIWKSVKLDTCFNDVKQGVAEELSIMLSNNKKMNSILPNLEEVSKLNKIAMKIFGYKIKE